MFADNLRMGCSGKPVQLINSLSVAFVLAVAEHGTAEEQRCLMVPIPRWGSERHYPTFRSILLKHHAVIQSYMGRPNQINRPSRGAVLFPALCEIAAEAETQTVGLIEIGPSLGLNLCLDQYEYDYGPFGTQGRIGSRCRIACELRSALGPSVESSPWVPDLSRPLEVAHRIGLELHPVELDDTPTVSWLCALARSLFATEPNFGASLDAALAIRRETPIEMLGGDGTVLLPSALRSIPDGATPVVLESFVSYQLAHDAFVRFLDAMRSHCHERPVFFISLGRMTRRGVALTITRFVDGRSTRRVFGYWDSRTDVHLDIVPPLRIDGEIYHPYTTSER
jgi:hypothetical protein